MPGPDPREAIMASYSAPIQSASSASDSNTVSAEATVSVAPATDRLGDGVVLPNNNPLDAASDTDEDYKSESDNLSESDNDTQIVQLAKPEVIKLIERLGLAVEIAGQYQLSATHIYHDDTIKQKVEAGKIKHVIKLDYDGTITTGACHSSKLAYGPERDGAAEMGITQRVKGFGFHQMMMNQPIGINGEETIKSILRLAVREDVLLVINSNHALAHVPFDTVTKLVAEEPNADELVKNIAVVTGSPASVLSDNPNVRWGYSEAYYCTEGNDFVTDADNYASRINDMIIRREPKMMIVRKGQMFVDFLEKMGMDLKTEEREEKMNLYTVDDSSRELSADSERFAAHPAFEHFAEQEVRQAYVEGTGDLSPGLTDESDAFPKAVIALTQEVVELIDDAERDAPAAAAEAISFSTEDTFSLSQLGSFSGGREALTRSAGEAVMVEDVDQANDRSVLLASC